MKRNNFFAFTALIFSAVFVVHALRLLNGWQVSFGSWSAPMIVSWLGLIVSGWLAWTAFRFLKNK